ncbi:MAG: hypothetical protein ABI589_13255 [Burkholderiales bacterium]
MTCPNWTKRSASLAISALMAACAIGPEPPDWKSNASSASERFVDAWLVGDTRIEQVEVERAREQTARTGLPDVVARIELLRCATRVASLVAEPCTGFEALRDALAAGPETAYADYLAGNFSREQVSSLPKTQREVATALLSDAGGAAAGAQRYAGLVRAIDDPLSRLVAAGVLFKANRAGDDVVNLAVDTASAQGWRRPLLAWLLVQARRAEAAGRTGEAETARQRIELVAPKRPSK